MPLQALWSLASIHPAQVLNTLALFLAIAGGWLLLATRLRERRSMARLVLENPMTDLQASAEMTDEPGAQLNRFFYCFAGACLLGALLLSGYSTGF